MPSNRVLESVTGKKTGIVVSVDKLKCAIPIKHQVNKPNRIPKLIYKSTLYTQQKLPTFTLQNIGKATSQTTDILLFLHML